MGRNFKHRPRKTNVAREEMLLSQHAGAGGALPAPAVNLILFATNALGLKLCTQTNLSAGSGPSVQLFQGWG